MSRVGAASSVPVSGPARFDGCVAHWLSSQAVLSQHCHLSSLISCEYFYDRSVRSSSVVSFTYWFLTLYAVYPSWHPWSLLICAFSIPMCHCSYRPARLTLWSALSVRYSEAVAYIYHCLTHTHFYRLLTYEDALAFCLSPFLFSLLVIAACLAMSLYYSTARSIIYNVVAIIEQFHSSSVNSR